MVNIAVFVSGSGTNLQALIDACANNEINGSIKLVVSNRKKAYGLERARLAGIKAEWIKDEDIIIKRLEEEQIDLIVLAGYLAIVSEKLISKFENKIINIHPSLIPSFCGEGYYGIHVHEACFKRGSFSLNLGCRPLNFPFFLAGAVLRLPLIPFADVM